MFVYVTVSAPTCILMSTSESTASVCGHLHDTCVLYINHAPASPNLHLYHLHLHLPSASPAPAPSASTLDTYLPSASVWIIHMCVYPTSASFLGACTIVNTSVTYADACTTYIYTCATSRFTMTCTYFHPHLWIICVHIYITYICIYIHLYLHFLCGYSYIFIT